MCTAITFQTKQFYFGRTLDHDESYQEEVTVIPREYPLPFLRSEVPHYAIIGMAHIADGFPLLYDGINEKGLGMAGLNFVDFSHYSALATSEYDIPCNLLIGYVLAQCATVSQAMSLLTNINISSKSIVEGLPCPQLHWIIADRTESITVEACQDGLHIHRNPVGVLTNNPPFDQQMLHLSNYMGLSNLQPRNTFPGNPDLLTYSNGMGALGLPGDVSSQSRFVRAAFMKGSSICEDNEISSVTQFFHVLETVSQVNGSCQLPNGNFEKTIYTSCCNCDKGIYYYTSYSNRQITAVNMHNCNLNAATLARYPLLLDQQIRKQN